MPSNTNREGPAGQPEAVWETPAGTHVEMVHQDHLVTYGCGRCHQRDSMSIQCYYFPVKRWMGFPRHPQLGTLEEGTITR